MDERLNLYIWNVEHQMDRLVDGIENLTEEQMMWIPLGVKNPISWILGHWADIFWLAFGMLSGKTLPIRPDRPGVPEGWLKCVSFDENAPEPGSSGQERLDYLEKAWSNLKGYLLENYPDCVNATVLTPHGEQSAWWLLELFFADMSYHGGQADLLKRLVPGSKALGK